MLGKDDPDFGDGSIREELKRDFDKYSENNLKVLNGKIPGVWGII